MLLQGVEIEDRIGDVRPQRRHLVLAQDVPPGELHEAAAVREAGEARLDEALAGQAVQHDVDPGAARGREDVLAEGGRAAVEHVLHAERAEVGLLGRARRGEHLRARSLRELDGGEPDAARAGVNQHAVPGLESGKLVREHACHEHRGDRGERRRRHARRRERDQFLPRHHLRPERAEGEAGHAVAHRATVATSGAGFDDPAAEFLAEQALLDQAHGAEDVQEVEPAGFDRDAHLPRLQGTRRQRLHPQRLDRAALVRRQHPVRLLRQGKTVRAGTRPNQPGRLAPPPAMRDVVLRIREQQLVCEDGIRLGCLGVEIEHPRLQLGRLPRHHPAQAPERGAGQLPGPLPLQHLRAPGDEPEALLRRGVRVRDALHERERAGRRAFRVRRHVCGRRVRSVAVLRDEMHRAGEGHIRGQAFDERRPRLAALHLDRCRDDPGLALCRLARACRIVARQHHPLVLCRELRRQRRRHAAPVGGQNPDALRQGDLRRTLRHDHPSIRQAGRCRPVHAENFGLREPGIGERLTPHVGPGEGVVTSGSDRRSATIRPAGRRSGPSSPGRAGSPAPPAAPTAREAPGSGRASRPDGAWRAARWPR